VSRHFDFSKNILKRDIEAAESQDMPWAIPC
jgi:hypothetical protein